MKLTAQEKQLLRIMVQRQGMPEVIDGLLDIAQDMDHTLVLAGNLKRARIWRAVAAALRSCAKRRAFAALRADK